MGHNILLSTLWQQTLHAGSFSRAKSNPRQLRQCRDVKYALPQFAQLVFDFTKFVRFHAVRLLFAIASNERDGVVIVEQTNDISN